MWYLLGFLLSWVIFSVILVFADDDTSVKDAISSVGLGGVFALLWPLSIFGIIITYVLWVVKRHVVESKEK